MANWFKNGIILSGTPDRLEAFKKAYFRAPVEGASVDHGTAYPYLDLETVPLPPEETESPTFGFFLWVDDKTVPDLLRFSFETRRMWPIPTIRKLLELWPDLKLEFYRGCDESDMYETDFDLRDEVL